MLTEGTLRKFGLAWVCLMGAFFIATYGVAWVWDDFGFAGITEAFDYDDVLGPIGMVLSFLPGIVALAISAWLRRARQ